MSRVLVLAAGALLIACVGTPSLGAPGSDAFDLNSATNSCRQSPLLCAKVPGEPPLLPLSVPVHVTASASITGYVVVQVLDATERARVEAVLTECTDMARSEILIRRFGERTPTAAECKEEVGRDARGEPVTRAMQLGEEMHQEALRCTQEKLAESFPGRFSLEPCYRHDPQSGRTTLISPEERRALLRQGKSCELVGSIRPDVVIHLDNPFTIQAVYDFKFPCVIKDIPPWRQYSKGHPHQGASQGHVYEKVLGVEARRVVPRWGIIP